MVVSTSNLNFYRMPINHFFCNNIFQNKVRSLCSYGTLMTEWYILITNYPCNDILLVLHEVKRAKSIFTAINMKLKLLPQLNFEKRNRTLHEYVMGTDMWHEEPVGSAPILNMIYTGS